MATRALSLECMEGRFGESRVAIDYHVQQLTGAPYPYSTEIGRGRGRVHVNNKWLGAVTLSLGIGDPGRAGEKVPTFGGLLLGGVLLEKRSIQYDDTMGALAKLGGPTLSTSFSTPIQLNVLVDKHADQHSFFEKLTDDIDAVARDWNGLTFDRILSGYFINITLFGIPHIRVSELYSVETDAKIWIHRDYFPAKEDFHRWKDQPIAPIQRYASLDHQHITLVAGLWRDTLKHWGEIEPDTEPSLAEGGEDVAVSANAKVGTDRAPTLPATDDDQPAKQAAPHNNGHPTRARTQSASVEPQVGLLQPIGAGVHYDYGPQYELYCAAE